MGEVINFSGAVDAAELAKLRRKAERTKLEDQLAQQIKLAGLPVPAREFPYAQQLQRKFRADFAFCADRLLIQVEGGIYSGGKHTRGKGFESDCERDALALILGWQVLRVTAKHIKSGLALKWIEQVLQPNRPFESA